MVTVKNLLGGAATAAMGALTLQSGAQARKPLEAAQNADPFAVYDGWYDYGDDPFPLGGPVASPIAGPAASPVASPAAGPAASPAAGPTASPAAGPTPPYFGGNESVPCVDVEFLAALDLLIVDFDSENTPDCADTNALNNDIVTQLESAFAPQVVTSSPYVGGVYATVEGQLTSLAQITGSPDACDNVTAYAMQVNDSVADLVNTLSLLDNVTVCEPYSD